MYLVRVITVSRTWGWEELGVGASPGSVLIMSVDLIYHSRLINYPQFIANTLNESLLETTSSLFKHLKEASVWVGGMDKKIDLISGEHLNSPFCVP